MNNEDKKMLVSLMLNNSVKDIIMNLSKISLEKSSEMVDLQLPESAKDWSEISFLLENICGLI